jgi:hypothetical protein
MNETFVRLQSNKLRHKLHVYADINEHLYFVLMYSISRNMSIKL